MEINLLGYTIRVEYIILSILLIVLISYNTSCSCYKKEGFEPLDNLGADINYIMGDNVKGSVHDLQFTNSKNSTLKEEMKNFMPPYEPEQINKKTKEVEINIYKDLETNAENHSDSLAGNTISFFKNTVFAPDCCPSNYSSSSGCACMTPEQMKFLGHRGGNRL